MSTQANSIFTPRKLRAGLYYRAKIQSQKGKVEEGQVVMVTSIKHKKKQAQTVTIRLHPSKTTFWQTKAKYSINDFLNSFEFIDQASAELIRKAEVKTILDKIQS